MRFTWAWLPGGGSVAKHVVKVSHGGGQVRVTIPKIAVRGLGWDDAVYVIIEENKDNTLTVRRFVDGESLTGANKKYQTGSH